MAITPYPFDLNQQKILDFDLDEYENFLAFTDQNEVFSPHFHLKIKQQFKFPLIRRLNAELLLIASARSASTTENAFIYNRSGEVITAFDIGDGIEDILIHCDKIIVSYFDEGVLGRHGPNNEGLCVFNFQGESCFGYNSGYSDEMIVDCYAICIYKARSILFYPYAEFQLYELNLDDFTLKKIITPEAFAGTYCISTTKHSVIFHSPYAHKSHFFEWYKNTGTITQIATNSRHFKTLRNGMFYSYDQQGYEIYQPLSYSE